MTSFVKDLYSIAYQFARRLSPKRSTSSAADYAKRMCILWLILGLLVVMAFVDVVLNMHVRNLLGRDRLELVVFSVTAVVLGYAVMGLWLRRIPEFQTPEAIERHYEQLPAGRRVLVPFLAGCPPIGILLLILARQFLGWFGGV